MTVTKRKCTEGFRKLIAWQEAKSLTLKIYEITKKFPPEERFYLVQQLRRASSSIMANLAEGSAMPTKAHQISFYSRAKGSTVEVDNFIELSFDLKYVSQEEYDDIVDHCARIIHLISRLIKS